MTLDELDKHIKQREDAWRNESTWDSVKHQIDTAIGHVMDRDRELLVENASERAIAHRIAVYLEWHYQPPDWNVDCVYNRMSEKRDPKQVTATQELPASKGSEGARVFPDIIVHRRGPDGPNLLAIEVKPADADKDDIRHDFEKLQGYLGTPKLGYLHAVFLTFHSGDNAKFDPVEPIKRRDGTR